MDRFLGGMGGAGKGRPQRAVLKKIDGLLTKLHAPQEDPGALIRPDWVPGASTSRSFAAQRTSRTSALHVPSVAVCAVVGDEAYLLGLIIIGSLQTCLHIKTHGDNRCFPRGYAPRDPGGLVCLPNPKSRVQNAQYVSLNDTFIYISDIALQSTSFLNTALLKHETTHGNHIIPSTDHTVRAPSPSLPSSPLALTWATLAPS